MVSLSLLSLFQSLSLFFFFFNKSLGILMHSLLTIFSLPIWNMDYYSFFFFSKVLHCFLEDFLVCYILCLVFVVVNMVNVIIFLLPFIMNYY